MRPLTRALAVLSLALSLSGAVALRAATHASASGARVATASLTETPAARGRRLYLAMHYDVTRLGYRIVFAGTSQGLLGLTSSGTRTITIYVRSTESDLVLRHSIAHEIGHAVDFTRNTPYRHSRYLQVRRLGTQPWYGCNGCTDYRTPAGDWAEVFAQWLAGPGDFRSQVGGVPTAAQLTALRPLFAL